MRVDCIKTAPALRYTNLSNNKTKENIPFKGMLDVADKYQGKRYDLERDIREFIDYPEATSNFLGKGMTAIARRFKKNPQIVIKTPLDDYCLKGEETYYKEADELNYANSKLPGENIQQFVCRYRGDRYPYKYYMLTEFTKGEQVEKDSRITRKAVNDLFDLLAKMDEKVIYHGDLSPNNILYDKDKDTVNLIDFQWSFHDGRKDCTVTPDFINIQNVQMLEMAFVGDYLSNIRPDERTLFFKMYLREKSKYYEKRADTFNTDFDATMAKVLKNPSDDVVKLELMKVQFLQSFRQAYGFVDPNKRTKNEVNSPVAYLQTYDDMTNFWKEAVTMYKKPENTPAEKEYFRYMAKYGKFWSENLKEWSDGTFNVIRDNEDKYRYMRLSDMKFEDTRDIMRTMGYKRDTQYYGSLENALRDNNPANYYARSEYEKIKDRISEKGSSARYGSDISYYG